MSTRRALSLLRFSPRQLFPNKLKPTVHLSNPISSITNNDHCTLAESIGNITIADEQSLDKNVIPTAMYSASASLLAATAVVTAGGYSMAPALITVVSGAPLLAFAYVQASGLSPILKIVADKGTGDFSPLPFISLFTNCAVWGLYGVLTSDQTILVANAAGSYFLFHLFFKLLLNTNASYIVFCLSHFRSNHGCSLYCYIFKIYTFADD